MKKSFQTLTLTAFAFLFASAWAAAQDLHQTYNVGPGGYIRIHNISGDIRVMGGGGSGVTVDAVATGRDADLLTIEDSSTSNGVDLRVKYPDGVGSFDASVYFEIRVPSGVDYDFDGIKTVSGDIEVSGAQGRLEAKSVSGGVKAYDFSGTVDAGSVSGDVEIEISQPYANSDMKFSSVSGDVIVRIPSGMDADVSASTVSGSIETNLPITIKENSFGSGHSAHGVVGRKGVNYLRLSSVSGGIRLTSN